MKSGHAGVEDAEGNVANMLNFIYEWPTWPLVLALLVLMLLANEFGFRLGRSRNQRESEAARTVSTALKASVFGLVALLLGFSFSITSNRHDMRRRLVLDEANAVGTCYLRAGLLDEPYRSDIRSGLRHFVDLRLEHFDKALDPIEFDRTTREMNDELAAIWKVLERVGREKPQSVLMSQIVPATNDVIDLSGTRAWAARNHISSSVLLLLATCVIVSSLLIGHSSGQTGERHVGLWASLNILLVLLMFVVLDFDRPRRGMIQLDHTPLFELKESLRHDPNP